MASGETQGRQEDVGASFDTGQLAFAPGTSDRFVYTQTFVPYAPAGKSGRAATAARAATTARSARAGAKAQARGAQTRAATAATSTRLLLSPGTPLAGVAGEIGSDVGLLFLDRTRIRPANAVLGEELLSLSLAPGEQVTIEQKTFSQRETSYEQQNETSVENNTELESTLSTALEQALAQQQSESSRTDMGIKGSVSVPLEGANISVDPSISHSVSDASSSSESTSLKRTTQTTQKISSKFRAVHKTTLRVSTQQQFTSSSQRTLRNPNAFTPIDLRYYKIYQELELFQERYGVRMVWAPTLMRPGAVVLAQAEAASKAVIDAALAAVSLPPAPTPPPSPQEETVASKAEVIKGGSEFLGLELGGEKTTVTLTVNPPAGGGWAWNGDVASVESELTDKIQKQPKEGPNIEVDGVYMTSSGAVSVVVHVGWGGPGELTLQAHARFVQSDSTQQQEYLQKYTAYQAEVATLRAQATASVQSEAQAARQAVIEAADPLAECLRQAVASDIPQTLRAAVPELELWRSLFEWDAASFTLFPGWWGGALADPQSAPDAFVNAFAARLLLPMRPGLEAAAAELVNEATQLAGGTTLPAGPISTLIGQLETFRTQSFGGPQELALGQTTSGQCAPVQEKYICMGAWRELLPTEGTHLEVVQASTAAADDLNQERLAEDAALRQAEAELIGSERSLQKAVEQAVPGAPLSVSVGVRASERLGGDRAQATETTALAPPQQQ